MAAKLEIHKLVAGLIPALKHKDSQEIPCVEIPLTGQLYDTVAKVVQKAPTECDIPIIFQNEEKQHPVRDLIVGFAANPGVDAARPLFERLAAVTTGVAGLSLTFACVAMYGEKTAVVLSRFPATEAIRTNISPTNFEVEVVKDIFMRSSRSYKAAYFADRSLRAGFWQGAVVDKQVNDGTRDVSEYWIFHFLESEFLITGKSGTAMFAGAIRAAIESEKDLGDKQQLISLATLLPNRNRQSLSMKSVCDELSIPEHLQDSVRRRLESPSVFEASFEFDADEFARQAVFKSVYLDNGSILSAETSRFEECFTSQDVAEDVVRYQTEGKVVDVKVRKRS